ncbi:carotenoid oxygenase family protein [Polyangium fumosum]|nr:carotenoid oxygenase family protein [Polyangium fumosum]
MTTSMTSSAESPAPPPYLSGNYAPVDREITAHDLPVIGEIPRDLAGVFVRNGSNPRFRQKGRYHWFDGDGMIHALRFEDGRARYANRWVRTWAFVEEEKAGASLWTGVTERPDFTNPRGPFKDTSNTDLVFHGGRLYSLWWLGGAAYVVHPASLDTCGTETWGGKMPTISAHPKVDAVTGELMLFDYKPFPPYLTYAVVSPAGELVHKTEIDLPGPRLQHDLAITEHFTIFFDMSMQWDPQLLAVGKTKVKYFRDKPARIGVLPRHAPGSEIRWFETDPFYMYHTINAWEEGDRIVLVGCKIDAPVAGDPQNPAREVPTIGFLRLEPNLYRWELDTKTGAVKESRLDDVLTEFPRMDNRALGRKTRYSYNPRLHASAPTLLFDGVIKYDYEAGTSTAFSYPAGRFGSEVVFAPRVGSKGEDDGYLVTFVVDEASGESEAYVLDAKDVTRAPLARVKLPQRVPTGYHAWWVPGSDLPA